MIRDRKLKPTRFPPLHPGWVGSAYDIFTYSYHTNQPNVGKYTSPMDLMDYGFSWNFPEDFDLHQCYDLRRLRGGTARCEATGRGIRSGPANRAVWYFFWAKKDWKIRVQCREKDAWWVSSLKSACWSSSPPTPPFLRNRFSLPSRSLPKFNSSPLKSYPFTQ